MSESELQRQIMLAVTTTGGRVFRNNMGQWEYAPGKFVKYGVCNPGGADLIGWTSTGRFLGIEVKNPGPDKTAKKRKEDQKRFRDAVNAAGGLCIQARSVAEVLEALRG
jgi:hypothetical protein